MHKRRGTSVRGYFRNGSWVSSHRRSGTTVKDSVSVNSQPPKYQYSYSPVDDLPVVHNNSCGPSNCPVCGARVFFIRHNGGSVWLDDLGWPWPIHPCFNGSQPSWLFYFRKFARYPNPMSVDATDTSILVGVLTTVVRAPASDGEGVRAFVAFDAGEDHRICLEILIGSNMMPKNGFFGALDMCEANLTLANYQKYQVLSKNVAPELLGVAKECITMDINKL